MSDAVSLFLVRHAIAADRGDQWPDDAARPLTRKGEARMRQNVAGLRALGVTVDLILTSPLVRAVDTAKILAAGLKPTPRLVQVPALAPGGSPAAMAEVLVLKDPVGAVALVGHEPDLGRFAAWLIGARAPLPFKKGAVCRIDVPSLPPGRNGRLIWFATPGILRAIDRQ